MSQTFARSKRAGRCALALVLAFGSTAALAQDAERPGITFTRATKPTDKPATKPTDKPAAGADITFEAPRPGTVTVSDRDFNRFVFPAPVRKLVMPAGSPVLGQPVYMANNTVVLVQFQRGADKPFEFIVETEQGTVHSVRVLPRPIDGVVYRVDGAREPRSGTDARRTSEDAPSATPRGADIELLKRVVAGDIPSGFDPVSLPAPTRFEKFTVVPLAGWSDGASRRVMAFSLVAVPGQTAVVAPPQFYRPGIVAVMVDGDVVDAQNSPTLYAVEEVNDE
jgi:hypothetical protein